MFQHARIVFFTVAAAVIGSGQTFSSGSTGANGALDLSSGDQTIQLPDSGVLNYTTVTIPAGRTLQFTPNLSNTPVIILAQGAVNIAGIINVSASGSSPGPGGFAGGDPGRPGFGPGAGQPNVAGQWVGSLSLVPNIGGSGGGGNYRAGCYYTDNPWGVSTPGGGGGGAITIASSASISLSGQILSNGGTPAVQSCWTMFYGSPGAAGAVRLVANSMNVSGNIAAATLRLEAPLSNLTYAGTGTVPVRATINPLVAPRNPPSVNFSSIGGYQVPSYAGAGGNAIDLLLPTQLLDPIPIVVRASNVPVGSPVTVSFSGPGSPTFTNATLSGTMASSTATIYASGLNRGGVTFLFVLVTFDPALIAGISSQGEPNGVAKVQLAAAPGAPTTYRYFRRDGSELPLSSVSPELRQALGL